MENQCPKSLILGLPPPAEKERKLFCLMNIKGQDRDIWRLKFLQQGKTLHKNMMGKWLIYLLWESSFSLWSFGNYPLERPILKTGFINS